MFFHPHHQRIVTALQAAVGQLNLREHLTIVGGLGSFLAGMRQKVGDIDVLIDAHFCNRYWEFIEILDRHEIVSLYDVFERPNFRWRPCCLKIEHALALTVDFHDHLLQVKQANLDIVLQASDLAAIPTSNTWVYDGPSREDLLRLDEPARNSALTTGHERLIQEHRQRDERERIRKRATRVLHSELQLYYCWEIP